MGRPGQKNIMKGRVVNQVVSVFHLDPPFKTAGPDGIRPGGLPRWLELLTKLAAILD